MLKPSRACADEALDRAPSELEEILGEDAAQIVIDALYRLRHDKVEALCIVRAEGLSPGGRPFEPSDFGIPQIDDLLKRLGADPVEEPLPSAEC